MNVRSRLGARTLLVLCVAFFAVTLAAPAVAQEQRSSVDAQNFDPALGPHAVYTVHQSGTLPHLQPGGELVFDYLSEPVVLERSDGETVSIVEQQLAADVLAGIGLTERGQVSLHLPFYLVNDGAFGADDFSGATVGDLSLRPKYQFLTHENSPIGLAGLVDLSLPTGDGQSFVGAPGVAAEPRVIADALLSQTMLSASLGVRLQQAGSIRNVGVGNQFTYGLGAEQTLVDGLVSIGGELYGHTQLDNFFGSAKESPLEGLLGAKVRTDPGFIVMAGAGGGLVPGLGAPEFRAFLGVSYPGKVRDSDGDGIDDGEDECPDEAEDLDGFEDADGCPDPDNDGDGIPDTEDKCPNEPEDKNGYEDDDGCPDGEQDSDGDGIPDAQDECPEKPEDKDGYQDDDGCPDPDNDGDGIADRNDECPDEAEDEDGFEDSDGCPDPDNDGDGIADKNDKCPDEPGLKAQDGCPAKEKKAVRKEEEIEILEKVFFEYDKAVIKEESYDLLNQVGLIIRTNSDIKKVRIEGHTDDIGSKEYNMELSRQRAKSVKEYLVDHQSVDPERLEVKGYGASEPLAPNTSEENRSKNRRVEFKILKQ